MKKLNLGCGPHLLPGFDNLDLPHWSWADQLPYRDNSVDGITVSHALMYADDDLWPHIFGEFYRVLKPEGIVRITEDATNDPASERFGGFIDCVSLTSFEKVSEHLQKAGFYYIHTAHPAVSWFGDNTLVQANHGLPPKVFHIEAQKH